jgi:uncharacterized protein (DUF1778 family)
MASGLKTDVLTCRCAPEEKALIEQAAALMHTDITGFVLRPAVQRARELIEMTILTDASRARFVTLLTDPAPPSDRFIGNMRDERHQIVD